MGPDNYAILHGWVCAKKHLVCQDFAQFKIIDTEKGPLLLAAVADGHGSKNCPRSAAGAQLAVATFLDLTLDLPNFVTKENWEEVFKSLLVSAWEKRIFADYNSKTLSNSEREGIKPPELALLEKPDKGEAQFSSKKRQAIKLLYGSTLMGMAISEEFAFFLQLGDGDTIHNTGKGSVFTHGKELGRIGNETESLCLPKAVNYIKTKFISFAGPNAKPFPQAVQITTDGYFNSFQSDTDFLKTLTDFQLLLNRNQPEEVGNKLGEWLQEASDVGSGDDIALIGIYKLEPKNRPTETTTFNPINENNRPAIHQAPTNKSTLTESVTESNE